MQRINYLTSLFWANIEGTIIITSSCSHCFTVLLFSLHVHAYILREHANSYGAITSLSTEDEADDKLNRLSHQQ